MTTKRTTQEDGSWSEWRRLVLNELSRLNKDIEDIKSVQRDIQIQIATQTTKLTMYALFGSAITGAIVTFAIRWLTKTT